jgi:hypothetical protein
MDEVPLVERRLEILVFDTISVPEYADLRLAMRPVSCPVVSLVGSVDPEKTTPLLVRALGL